jgi:hypothetical protein
LRREQIIKAVFHVPRDSFGVCSGSVNLDFADIRFDALRSLLRGCGCGSGCDLSGPCALRGSRCAWYAFGCIDYRFRGGRCFSLCRLSIFVFSSNVFCALPALPYFALFVCWALVIARDNFCCFIGSFCSTQPLACGAFLSMLKLVLSECKLLFEG